MKEAGPASAKYQLNPGHPQTAMHVDTDTAAPSVRKLDWSGTTQDPTIATMTDTDGIKSINAVSDGSTHPQDEGTEYVYRWRSTSRQFVMHTLLDVIAVSSWLDPCIGCRPSVSVIISMAYGFYMLI